MVINGSRQPVAPKYHIGSYELKLSHQVRDLGILYTDSLDFDEYIQRRLTLLNASTLALRRTIYDLNSLYNSFAGNIDFDYREIFTLSNFNNFTRARPLSCSHSIPGHFHVLITYSFLYSLLCVFRSHFLFVSLSHMCRILSLNGDHQLASARRLAGNFANRVILSDAFREEKHA
ncbi:hypothetical protein Y032_0029g1882 [Ancylostoma ceylanicum]|uniref:Uncharacterized protein n=1 Tax=Ancylostoma ceylanicum TaxID=53326 RepID=A0A016USL0_9BILA|nr:hypothetical protein Y032_0029g1882 [Ancylostoma ceylanicum]